MAPTGISGDRESLAAYAYSYPHKSSYRPLVPAVPLADAWRDEDVGSLSLYVHLPFCEMRCGFCNLFTQSQPPAELVDAYLTTLQRQMQVVRSAVPDARFAQFAVGGGTPTFLNPRQIESLLRQIETTFETSLVDLPTSVETSPATATSDRLRVLEELGVRRISLGVQSFDDDDLSRIGRPQQNAVVHRALEAIRSCRFPVLNIDLMYGDPEQTRAAWLASIGQALRYRPEELYLYPLYIRPHTGLACSGRRPADHRVDLYRAARDLLLERGYFQESLRAFRRPDGGLPSTYACQRDGMIGLGCGARSYTRRLHFATRFAVTQAGIRALLSEWISQSDAELSLATHGVRLSEGEQRRRYFIMSLLQAAGISLAEYHERFGSFPEDDIPELEDLWSRGWVARTENRLVLTTEGLERSDEAGPLLYSPAVYSRLREFVEL